MFNYFPPNTGSVQSFTAADTGTYQIQCWGASGGGSSTVLGGRGAYVKGCINLIAGKTLYVYVGEQGDVFNTRTPIKTEYYTSSQDPSDIVTFTLGRTGKTIYNNGGESVSIQYSWTYPGGGSTDLRLTSGAWNEFSSLKSRVIVAAGGGGACTYNTNVNGAAAGALLGLSGNGNGGGTGNNSTGGEQTQGGLHGTGDHMYPNSKRAGFGYTYYNYVTTGGGGNGYYAGGNGNHGSGTVGSGGGGSSFISGYIGCNAIKESSTESNIVHSDSSNHYSGYVFTNSVMIAGNASMPSPIDSTETGHTGNGYAIITQISF